MDELLVQVEGVPGVYQQGGEKGGQKAGQKDSTEAFRQRVAADLQRTLGIRTQVEVVAPETFPRTDFKARRVVDDRQVFRDMHQRLDPRP